MSEASDEWAYDKARGLLDATGDEYKAATGFNNAREAMAATKELHSGVVKEGMELAYYCKTNTGKQRRFVLRTTDDHWGQVPCWVEDVL
jgi:hypothetical protein